MLTKTHRSHTVYQGATQNRRNRYYPAMISFFFFHRKINVKYRFLIRFSKRLIFPKSKIQTSGLAIHYIVILFTDIVFSV